MGDVTEVRGSIFETGCDAIAVTVNCEGVMGAGIALDAKLRWPDMFEEYAAVCERGALKPGGVAVWSGSTPDAHRVIWFATKGSWKHPSRLRWVTEGLLALPGVCRSHSIRSVALPHLGCSHGGLTWAEVFPEVRRALEPADELRAEIYAFDPTIPDRWMTDLRRTLSGLSPEAIGKTLGISGRPRQVLAAAIADPSVLSLAALHRPGLGEKTLAKAYRHALAGVERAEQGELRFDEH